MVLQLKLVQLLLVIVFPCLKPLRALRVERSFKILALFLPPYKFALTSNELNGLDAEAVEAVLKCLNKPSKIELLRWLLVSRFNNALVQLKAGDSYQQVHDKYQ